MLCVRMSFRVVKMEEVTKTVMKKKEKKQNNVGIAQLQKTNRENREQEKRYNVTTSAFRSSVLRNAGDVREG